MGRALIRKLPGDDVGYAHTSVLARGRSVDSNTVSRLYSPSSQPPSFRSTSSVSTYDSTPRLGF